MKNLTIFSIVLLMVVVCLAGIVADNRQIAESKEVALVSDGLKIIANNSKMIKSGITGRDLSFEPIDFERALNVDRVNFITLTEAPDPAIG